MDDKLRKGTRVKIIKDVREGAHATGMLGKFVGVEPHEAWLLCTADGKPERESYDLPEGYIEWDPEKEEFPKANCGIRDQNPRFQLDDDSFIHGGQCYWDPVTPRIRQRLYESHQWLLRRLGTPENQIPTLEKIAEMQSGSLEGVAEEN